MKNNMPKHKKSNKGISLNNLIEFLKNKRMMPSIGSYNKRHTHSDSGFRCLVAHPDGMQCKKCDICGEFYK